MYAALFLGLMSSICSYIDYKGIDNLCLYNGNLPNREILKKVSRERTAFMAGRASGNGAGVVP